MKREGYIKYAGYFLIKLQHFAITSIAFKGEEFGCFFCPSEKVYYQNSFGNERSSLINMLIFMDTPIYFFPSFAQ